MNWDDTGFLLSKNRYSENSLMAEFFTKDHGKVSGIIFGGTSKKIKNYLQIGNKIYTSYNSKSENRVGYFKIEIHQALSPLYFDNQQKLSCISSAMHLVKLLTAVSQKNLTIYNLIENFYTILGNENWIKNYIFWELELFKILGYQLEFSELVDEKIVFVDDIHSYTWYQSKIGREKVEKLENKKRESAKLEKEKRRNNLIEKYGEEFGPAILSKKVLNDMTPEMVIDSLGEPKYKDSDKWYYGTKKSFKKFIEFKNEKVIEESKCDGVWLDMSLELLIASMGKPADEKKNITKKGTKIKLYFGARKTRQKTTVYKLEVRLEDDVVVGFRELE